MADFHNKNSFLKATSVVDFYLGVNDLPSIPARLGDSVYEIPSAYENRPDLLAHELYGSPRLWWIFAMRNPDIIRDPINDFVSGTTIYLPSKQTVQSITG